MSSTFAGNLTLLGSMANLIVAERAEARGERVGFVDYLRAGVPVTLLLKVAVGRGVGWPVGRTSDPSPRTDDPSESPCVSQLNGVTASATRAPASPTSRRCNSFWSLPLRCSRP